jgi:ABC-type multidrug transport system ATPase subunit
MRTALGIVVGLAARAELTLLDEPYAGLDAVARTLFYDRLLADCTAHPRCIVLSTHLIDEAAELLDRVLVLDRGRLGPRRAHRRPARHRHDRHRAGRRRGAVRRRPHDAEPAHDGHADQGGDGRSARRS